MQKEEFLNEAEAKKNAMKYFPNFFDSVCSIPADKTLTELREEYLKYCEKYFTMIGQNDDKEKIMIKKAYDYIINMLENREKTYYYSKFGTVKLILCAYEELITAISNYRFRTHGDNSIGAKQNHTNQNILLELSLLKPMLTMVLVNIETYFGRLSNVTEVNSIDNELRKKLEELIEKLDRTCESLVNAEEKYHNAWDLSKRGWMYISDSVLGKVKAEWKFARNNACQTILDFYREMQEINMLLDPEYIVHSVDVVNELYNRGINNITKGPNYYCYLGEEERNKLTEQNLLRKRKLKNPQN